MLDDDWLPLNPYDTAYDVNEPHGAVRVIEGVQELGLLFDTRWIHADDAEAVIEERTEAAIAGSQAVLVASGFLPSDGVAGTALHSALSGCAKLRRPFDLPEAPTLFCALVEVLDGSRERLLEALESDVALVGHADLSFPSHLRSIVTGVVTYYEAPAERLDACVAMTA